MLTHTSRRSPHQTIGNRHTSSNISGPKPCLISCQHAQGALGHTCVSHAYEGESRLPSSCKQEMQCQACNQIDILVRRASVPAHKHSCELLVCGLLIPGRDTLRDDTASFCQARCPISGSKPSLKVPSSRTALTCASSLDNRNGLAGFKGHVSLMRVEQETYGMFLQTCGMMSAN